MLNLKVNNQSRASAPSFDRRLHHRLHQRLHRRLHQRLHRRLHHRLHHGLHFIDDICVVYTQTTLICSWMVRQTALAEMRIPYWEIHIPPTFSFCCLHASLSPIDYTNLFISPGLSRFYLPQVEHLRINLDGVKNNHTTTT
jgi:hypothetical protein